MGKGARTDLGKRDSEQARAEKENTGNGYGEETVRGKFFTCHDKPPTVRRNLVFL